MNRIFNIVVLLLAVSLGACFDSCYSQTASTQGNRQSTVAGSFYPANQAELKAKLEVLFREAEPAVPIDGIIHSLIVPHAGYTSSGKVAASAYKSIPKDAAYKNVFIIASSHREQFNGASVYPGGNYMTPVGQARINREIAAGLMGDNQILYFLLKAPLKEKHAH